MPKITDPDCLKETTQGGGAINLLVDPVTTPPTIRLLKDVACSNLTDCGVTFQALYSKLKILWKDFGCCVPCPDVRFAAYNFPIISITDEQFELQKGWEFYNCDCCVTRQLIRDGGWATVDANCVRKDEYMGLVTLGNFDTTLGGLYQAAACPCTVDFAAGKTITRDDMLSWFDSGFNLYNPLIITNAGANNRTNAVIATITGAGCCIITVGTCCACFCLAANCAAATFTQSGTGIAYYNQEGNGPTTCINLNGPVNQGVKIAEVTAEYTPVCLTFSCAGTIVRSAGTWICTDMFGPTAPFFVTVTSSCATCNNDGTFLIETVCCMTLTVNTADTLVTKATCTTARVIQEDDNRNYFRIWLREEKKSYDFYDLITCQVLNNGLINKKFALPLSDNIDNKIPCADNLITCMCVFITYHQIDQCIALSCACATFPYRVVIDASCETNATVYQIVQKKLRANAVECHFPNCGDICDGGEDRATAIITGGVTFDVLDACIPCCPFTITRTCGSWISDGFGIGTDITVTASEDACNNNVYRAIKVETLILTIDKTYQDACMAIDSATGPDTTASFAHAGTTTKAEITTATMPAQSGNICAGDYWILNSANDTRKYHVWYQIAAAGTEPVVPLSTGILVCIAACASPAAVGCATRAALAANVVGLTKNTHLRDFTITGATTDVIITNRETGRTTDASDFNTGATFSVGTQGDISTSIGEIQDELLTFVGCCLVTSTGVYIDHILSACLNCVTLTDVCGVGQTFAFVATGQLQFNPNLVSDGAAKYFMYHTSTVTKAALAATVSFNACANTITRDTCLSWTGGGGACMFCLVADCRITIACSLTVGNDGCYRIVSITGANCCILTVCTTPGICMTCAGDAITLAVKNLQFGTVDATLVQDNAAAKIFGCITGACAPCAAFTYDFDNNSQGGRLPASQLVQNVTVVAIGLCTAQHVTATSDIARTKTNNISVVAPLERNFNNP